MKDMKEKNDYVKEAFAYLEKINSSVTQEYSAFLNNDLTPKQLFLLQIVRDNKRITVNEISERMRLSPSSVSQLITRLEKEKYLKREINPNHRREILVQLDSNGIHLFRQYEEIDRHIIEKYYAEFTVEEVILFRDLTKKLYNTITMKRKESR